MKYLIEATVATNDSEPVYLLRYADNWMDEYDFLERLLEAEKVHFNPSDKTYFFFDNKDRTRKEKSIENLKITSFFCEPLRKI